MEGNKFYLLADFENEDTLDATDGKVTTPTGIILEEQCIIYPENEEGKPVSQLIEEEIQVLVKYPTNRSVSHREEFNKYKDVKWCEAVAVLKACSEGTFTLFEYILFLCPGE